MTQTATALVQFKHCSFGEHYSEAIAAYDSAYGTAWIVPFTAVQRALWNPLRITYMPGSLAALGATLGGTRIINKAAEDLATQRLSAVQSSAMSAYQSCVAGGANNTWETPQETGGLFRVSVNTLLNGVVNGNSVPSSGLSTQLSVSFAPVEITEDPLAWQPFYKLGVLSGSYMSPQQWGMDYSGSDPYSGQAQFTDTPMRTSITVSHGQLTGVSALFEQGLGYPLGYPITTPKPAGNRLSDRSFDAMRVFMGGAGYDNYSNTVNVKIIEGQEDYVVTFPEASVSVISPGGIGGDEGSGSYIDTAPGGTGSTDKVVPPLTLTVGYYSNGQLRVYGVPDGSVRTLLKPQEMTYQADELIPIFNLESTSLTFQVARHVLMPDGELYTYTVDFNAGTEPAGSYEVEFPPLSVDCGVSGTVYVRHAIHEFVINAEYTLSSDIQKVQIDDGSIHDFPILVQGQGAVHQWGGSFPDAYRYIQESFYYESFTLNIGIVRVKYFQGGVFQYQRMFLVWNGAPLDSLELVGLDSNAVATKFYGKHLSQTYATDEPLTISGTSTGTSPISVPVIEDVMVTNINFGVLSVGASGYVSYNNSIIKVHNTLKPLNVFTPYGAFVEEQPSYQATGNFLSVLPDFVDYINFKDLLGISMLYATHNGVIYARAVYLVYKNPLLDSEVLQGYTSNMPLPGVMGYAPVSPLPTAFSVTFSKTGTTPITVDLAVIESAYVDANISVAKDVWLLGTSPEWGSKLTPPTGTVRTSWQAAYDSVTADKASAWDRYYTVTSAIYADYPTYESQDSEYRARLNAAATILDADLLAADTKIDSLNAAWTSWLVKGGTALADLTTPSAHVYSGSSTVRGSQIIRHNIVAPKAMSNTNLTETHTGTGPWVFGDILPDFY